MEIIKEYLPFFIPVIIIQLVLAITAVVHILRHPHYKFGNKILWIVIALAVNIIGPIVYFVFGRGEE